ncbi:MAG: 4-hydroxy-3-methylbut-2-enyl diphosphate reductase [Bacillota bacterium]
MEVLALTPRGYCHGVVNAIKIMRNLVHDEHVKKPIHVLGMVVHNRKITDEFNALGLKALDDTHKSRLELLDEIDDGTIVFTAHGVSDLVYEKAISKGLEIIDTTCTDVKTSQETIKNYLKADYDVIFIGKKHHPESETALSYSDKVHLVTSVSDVLDLRIDNDRIAITNQTTMSLFDIYKITEAIRAKFELAVLIEEQCDATKTRQLAVMNQPKDVDHCFVVGDPKSNNSNKLVSVAQKEGIAASLIQGIEDLDIDYLKTINKVSVTSGASTPSQVTKEVVTFLEAFDKNDESTHDTTSSIKHLF